MARFSPTPATPALLVPLFVLVFLFSALLPTASYACACDDASMVEAMNLQIADRAKKLERIRKSGKPPQSPSSNPWVLRREIEEILVARETILRGIAECRKQCLMPDNANIYDPDSADTGIAADCPECGDRENALREEEARLGLALRNLDLFRQQVMPGVAADETAASFHAENAAYEREAVHNAEVEEIYDAMIRARDAACRNSILAEGGWREQKRRENSTIFDDPLEDQSSDIQPERVATENLVYHGDIKVRRSGRQLYNNDTRMLEDEWIGENGVTYTPAQIEQLRQEEDTQLSQSQWNQKTLAEMESSLETLVHGTAQTAAELYDQFMDLPAHFGFDVFPHPEISDYGACMRLGRAARRYFQDVVVPSRDALSKLGGALPGGRWDRLQELKDLEAEVRQARQRRDAALQALIECNVRSCLRKEDTGAGFEDDAASEPEDEDAPAAENEGNEGEDTASPGDVSMPELESDGSGPVVMMPEIELPSVEKPGLGHFIIPGLSDNAAAPAASAVRQPPDQCGHEPANVCAKLGAPHAAECTAIVENWRVACNEVIAHRRDNDMAQCLRRCEMMASEASDANRLRALALRLIADNDPQTSGPLAEELAAAQVELFNARLDFEETVETLEDLKIHIYVNADTGAVVQHDGPYFDPNPPLVYSGFMKKRPSPSDMERLKSAEARITALQAKIADLTARLGALGGWRTEATAFWMGEDPGSRVGCLAPSIPGQLQQCVAFCEQQQHPGAEIIPEPLPICTGTAMLGLLYQPSSRDHLYPPGHPWRQQGHGR